MTRDAIVHLRMLLLEAEASAAANDPSATLGLIAAMQSEVVNVSSRYGEFRQRFDAALSDCDSWLHARDLAAAQTSLDWLRILIGSLVKTVTGGSVAE